MLDINGLFLLDKPLGARSTDCVNKFHAALMRLAQSANLNYKIKIRTGHAGTLDSTASGLLILLAGRATRLSDYIMTLPKVYRATLRLGQTTDTCDYSGNVIFQCNPCDPIKISDLPNLTNRLDKILPSFQGWRMQRPPEISALKLNGRPSYKIARSGQNIKLAPRPVFLRSVKRISDVRLDITWSAPVVHVDLEISCSKGTYIRSLARDIGEALGCGACIESLRRLSIGGFHVDDALSLDTITNTKRSPTARLDQNMFLSPREVVKNFHRVLLTPEAESRLCKGIATPLVGAGQFIVSDDLKTHVGMPSLTHDILCVEGADMIGFCDLVRPDLHNLTGLTDLTNLTDTASASVNKNDGSITNECDLALTTSSGILLKPRANILLNYNAQECGGDSPETEN